MEKEMEVKIKHWEVRVEELEKWKSNHDYNDPYWELNSRDLNNAYWKVKQLNNREKNNGKDIVETYTLPNWLT